MCTKPCRVSLTLLLVLHASVGTLGQSEATSQEQDPPVSMTETLRKQVQTWKEIRRDHPDANPVFGGFFDSQLRQAEKQLELWENAKGALPVDRELADALRPMAQGRFREAHAQIEAYLRRKPQHQMAGFCRALCQIELGRFRQAREALDRAFPHDDEFPVVQLLKLFCERLAPHADDPSARQICAAYAWADATARKRLEARDPSAVLTFGDPLLADMVLFRSLMLGEEPGEPLYLSAGTFYDAAAKVDSPWVPIVLATTLEFDESETESAPGVDASAPARIVAILSEWYGQDKRFQHDGPARLRALRQLQALDADNGVWKLLEIPYKDPSADEDGMVYTPLSARELELFFAAIKYKTVRIDYAEFQQAVRSLVRATGFPYVSNITAAVRPPFNILPHASNVARRAEAAAKEAEASGDRERAVRTARALIKLSACVRDPRSKPTFVAELIAQSIARRAHSCLALIHRDEPELRAADLRALAEVELWEEAAVVCQGAAVRIALPLAMLDQAYESQGTHADRLHCATIRLHADRELVSTLREGLDGGLLLRRSLCQAVIANVRELVPTLTARLDADDFESAWRTVWTLGKLRDERARPKLVALAKHSNATLRAMARWSLAQLDRPQPAQP